MLPLLTQGGGAEKYFINLASQLSNDHTQVDIITLDPKSFKIYARFIHIFTHFNFFGQLPLQGRETTQTVNHQLGQSSWIQTSFVNLNSTLKNYNLVYAKNEILDLLVLKLFCQNKLPPLIVGVHTPLIFEGTNSFLAKTHNWLYRSQLYYWLIKDAACIHCSNQFTKKFITNRFHLPTSLIFYPYDISQTKTTNSVKSISKKLKIAFVGRLSAQKGTDLLIQLIKDIPRNLYSKFTINIFGSGDQLYIDQINILIKNYPFVKYYGHVQNSKLLALYQHQHLLLSTSRWEVLPYNILEAQSFGLPVIAFNIPGPQDIINQNTGILVNTYQELLDSTIKFINHYYNFDKNIITKNIQTKFEPSKIYRQLSKLLIKYSHDNKQA